MAGAPNGSTRVHDRHGALDVIAVGAGIGLLVGLLTSPLQGWLPDSFQSLANSAGTWSLVAFLVARRAANVLVAVLTASITLACCEVGYAIATVIRGDANASSTVAFWLLAAVFAGPPLGLAARWSTRTEPIRHGCGFGAMSGVLIGEGIYGLTEISDTTDSRYWTAEIIVGLVLIGVVLFRRRSIVALVACLAATVATGIVVYGVAVVA